MPSMNASMARAQPLHEHLHSLRAHLGQCRHARGPMFALGCLAERMHGLVAGRFVTTVVLAVGVLPLASLWP
ncbi:MAG: hypothetical protein RL654_283 [Pseudomonadota bacterium]|jgi:hypothetical protein